mmetsp:Transcript_18313/g.26380  ORF Transcript_18313/g.26380 Transcript_18313/m.26380 type:complete len:318 (+) Transcript_18313:1749-2702(+)
MTLLFLLLFFLLDSFLVSLFVPLPGRGVSLVVPVSRSVPPGLLLGLSLLPVGPAPLQHLLVRVLQLLEAGRVAAGLVRVQLDGQGPVGLLDGVVVGVPGQPQGQEGPRVLQLLQLCGQQGFEARQLPQVRLHGCIEPLQLFRGCSLGPQEDGLHGQGQVVLQEGRVRLGGAGRRCGAFEVQADQLHHDLKAQLEALPARLARLQRQRVQLELLHGDVDLVQVQAAQSLFAGPRGLLSQQSQGLTHHQHGRPGEDLVVQELAHSYCGSGGGGAGGVRAGRRGPAVAQKALRKAQHAADHLRRVALPGHYRGSGRCIRF